MVFTSSGSLSGTPGVGRMAHIRITITASNGIVPNATQQFTLVVNPNSMGITSPDTATFQAGTAGSFAITVSIPLRAGRRLSPWDHFPKG